MSESAFGVLSGADRGRYERASQALIPTFRHMQRFGKHVVGDVVRRLHIDVDHIHTNLPRFELGHVDQWLRKAIVELESYADCMGSM